MMTIAELSEARQRLSHELSELDCQEMVPWKPDGRGRIFLKVPKPAQFTPGLDLEQLHLMHENYSRFKRLQAEMILVLDQIRKSV